MKESLTVLLLMFMCVTIVAFGTMNKQLRHQNAELKNNLQNCIANK